jgi:hypothetical protein
MSLNKVAELFCDECSYWIRIDTGRLSDVWPVLSTEGWTRKNGQHFCAECSNDKEQDK